MVKYISKKSKKEDLEDRKMVVASLQGNQKALENIFRKYQPLIYNLSVRMLFNPQDASDITNEIFIKVFTNLSGFKGKNDARFSTWLYKVAYHHIINKNKREYERLVPNFSTFGQIIDSTPMVPFPEKEHRTQEDELLIEEAKNMCMTAMLLCLNRKHRMAFILGGILGLRSWECCAIMEVSESNFKKMLSRARKQVFDFFSKKCSLVNDKNRCHCEGKVKPYIQLGEINPSQLNFISKGQKKINEVVEGKTEEFTNFLSEEVSRLYKEQPFYEGPDLIPQMRELFQTEKFENLFSIKKTMPEQ